MPLLPGRAVPGPKPSCSILLGQYPNYQRATRPQCNRLATVGRRDYAAGRPVLRSAGPGSPGGPVQRPAPGRPVRAAGQRPVPAALWPGPPACVVVVVATPTFFVGAATTMTNDWRAEAPGRNSWGRIGWRRWR